LRNSGIEGLGFLIWDWGYWILDWRFGIWDCGLRPVGATGAYAPEGFVVSLRSIVSNDLSRSRVDGVSQIG